MNLLKSNTFVLLLTKKRKINKKYEKSINILVKKIIKKIRNLYTHT